MVGGAIRKVCVQRSRQEHGVGCERKSEIVTIIRMMLTASMTASSVVWHVCLARPTPWGPHGQVPSAFHIQPIEYTVTCSSTTSLSRANACIVVLRSVRLSSLMAVCPAAEEAGGFATP